MFPQPGARVTLPSESGLQEGNAFFELRKQSAFQGREADIRERSRRASGSRGPQEVAIALQRPVIAGAVVGAV